MAAREAITAPWMPAGACCSKSTPRRLGAAFQRGNNKGLGLLPPHPCVTLSMGYEEGCEDPQWNRRTPRSTRATR